MKKFYLTTASLFPLLNNEVDETKLMENMVAIFTGARFFWRTPQKYEVDVVLTEGGKPLPVEVKYGEHITKRDVKNLLRFCEKFGARRALVVTRDKSGEEEFKLKNGGKVRIGFIPAWRFLLKGDPATQRSGV